MLNSQNQIIILDEDRYSNVINYDIGVDVLGIPSKNGGAKSLWYNSSIFFLHKKHTNESYLVCMCRKFKLG